MLKSSKKSPTNVLNSYINYPWIISQFFTGIHPSTNLQDLSSSKCSSRNSYRKPSRNSSRITSGIVSESILVIFPEILSLILALSCSRMPLLITTLLIYYYSNFSIISPIRNILVWYTETWYNKTVFLQTSIEWKENHI